jgi:hypothetical protein
MFPVLIGLVSNPDVVKFPPSENPNDPDIVRFDVIEHPPKFQFGVPPLEGFVIVATLKDIRAGLLIVTPHPNANVPTPVTANEPVVEVCVNATAVLF